MALFIACTDPDTMVYLFRVARALSDVCQRKDDVNDEDEKLYDYVHVQYYDRTFPSLTKQNKPLYDEWKQRCKQMNNKQIPDDTMITRITKYKPILLIFSQPQNDNHRFHHLSKEYYIIRIDLCITSNSTTTTASFEKSLDNINDNEYHSWIEFSTFDDETIAQIIYYHIKKLNTNQNIAGVIVDYLNINDENIYLERVIQPVLTVLLPWLAHCKSINKNTLIFIPNIGSLTNELTSNNIQTTWLNGKSLRYIYSTQPLLSSQLERVPLIRMAQQLMEPTNESIINCHEDDMMFRTHLNNDYPFLLITFRLNSGNELLKYSPVQYCPLPSIVRTNAIRVSGATVTNFNSALSIKSDESDDIDFLPSSDDGDNDDDYDSVDSDDSKEFDKEDDGFMNDIPMHTVMQLTKPIQTKWKFVSQRKNEHSHQRIDDTNQDYNGTFKPGDRVDVKFGNVGWLPAIIIERIKDSNGEPLYQRSTNYSKYIVQWYWCESNQFQCFESIWSNVIRPAIDDDEQVEVEYQSYDTSDDDSSSSDDNGNDDDDDDSSDDNDLLTLTTTRRQINQRKAKIKKSKQLSSKSKSIKKSTSKKKLKSIRRIALKPIIHRRITRLQIKQASSSSNQKNEARKKLQLTAESMMNNNTSTSTNNTNSNNNDVNGIISSSTTLYPRITLDEMKLYTWGPEAKTSQEKKEAKEAKKKNQIIPPLWEWCDSFLYWCEWDDAFTAKNTIQATTMKKIDAALKQM